MRPFSKAIDRLIQKRKTQQSETQTVMAPVTRAELERVFAYVKSGFARNSFGESLWR